MLKSFGKLLIAPFKLIYRARQFMMAMFSVYTKADRAFARSFLNIQEMSLFNQLPDFEKKHSVRVAKRMLSIVHNNPKVDYHKIAKIGLLHDIGKVAEHSSTLSKSFMVILRFFLPGYYSQLAEKGRTNQMFRRYFVHKHHGEIGAQLLARIGVSADITNVIKKHDPHLEPIEHQDPEELKILRKADIY